MIAAKRIVAALALGLSGLTGACASDGSDGGNAQSSRSRALIPLTITSSNGRHVFRVEVARTVDEQAQGLMFRTDIAPDSGMLFAPYPPQGGAPREASFWMKNTPRPLDIIFIREDGTIARIAENTVPYDESPIPSGEPVAAVLELNGGKTSELGIGPGDQVSWPRD